MPKENENIPRWLDPSQYFAADHLAAIRGESGDIVARVLGFPEMALGHRVHRVHTGVRAARDDEPGNRAWGG